MSELGQRGLARASSKTSRLGHLNAAPYRRQAVVVVGPDGAQMDTDEVSALKARFRGTLFEAALDADKGSR